MAEPFQSFYISASSPTCVYCECMLCRVCIHTGRLISRATEQEKKMRENLVRSLPHRGHSCHGKVHKTLRLVHASANPNALAHCGVESCEQQCRHFEKSSSVTSKTASTLPHQRLIDGRAALDGCVGSTEGRSAVPSQQHLVERFRQLLVPVLR